MSVKIPLAALHRCKNNDKVFSSEVTETRIKYNYNEHAKMNDKKNRNLKKNITFNEIQIKKNRVVKKMIQHDFM